MLDRREGSEAGGDTATPRKSSGTPGKRTQVDRLLARAALRRVPDGGDRGVDADAAMEAAAGSSGAPLPAGLQGRLEGALGQDLSGVRIHTGGAAAEGAAAVDARAFAVGQDVYFGAGEYDPESVGGQQLIAHEVAHTVQQRGAAAAPARKGIEVSSPSDPHEVEADGFAAAFVAGGTAPVTGVGAGAVARATIQREARGGGVEEGTPIETSNKNKMSIPATTLLDKKLKYVHLKADFEGEFSWKTPLSKTDADGNAVEPEAKSGVKVFDQPMSGDAAKSAPEAGAGNKVEATSGGSGHLSKGAGFNAEVKEALGAKLKSDGGAIDLQPYWKGGLDVYAKESKLAVTVGVEGKVFDAPIDGSLEGSIVRWEAGKPPVFGELKAGISVPVIKIELPINGQPTTVEGKAKLSLRATPEWSEIGAKIMETAATRLGPRLLAAIPAGAAIGIGVLGGLALARFTRFVTDADYVGYASAAADAAQAYCTAYLAGVRGEKNPGAGEEAQRGFADGKAFVTQQGLPAGAVAAALGDDADIYGATWKEVWPKFSAQAIARYRKHHPFKAGFPFHHADKLEKHLHNWDDHAYGGPDKP